MSNPDCPNQDGAITPDPYEAGIVECVLCHLQYHHPCAPLFRKCAGCGQPLKTKRVFHAESDKPKKVVMTGSRKTPRTATGRPMVRKPSPAKVLDRIAASSSGATGTGNGCLTLLLAGLGAGGGLLWLAHWIIS
jgi:hypothetical protein